MFTQCGDRRWTSEYDDYRRQIQTPKVDHCAVRATRNMKLMMIYKTGPTQSNIVSMYLCWILSYPSTQQLVYGETKLFIYLLLQPRHG